MRRIHPPRPNPERGPPRPSGVEDARRVRAEDESVGGRGVGEVVGDGGLLGWVCPVWGEGVSVRAMDREQRNGKEGRRDTHTRP